MQGGRVYMRPMLGQGSCSSAGRSVSTPRMQSVPPGLSFALTPTGTPRLHPCRGAPAWVLLHGCSCTIRTVFWVLWLLADMLYCFIRFVINRADSPHMFILYVTVHCCPDWPGTHKQRLWQTQETLCVVSEHV